ncbi:EamA family transporter [Dyadobacter tibetensis]|uniref:EamA family transporter n=1 Tax=Dyadobacter tibetensis TaxID=1211851 RepID=UPI000470517C|nr:EamA family transporter [Dyadobacter tibetensis]
MKTVVESTSAPSQLKVVLAFAIVYIVWGSTYFFIQKALVSFPPFILGAIRFISAGILMLTWGILQGEKMFTGRRLIVPVVTGLLLLFVGNGIVIWVQQSLPSAMVAIFVSSSPIWFVIMDRPMWRENFSNKTAIIGLLVGFAGVILLFYDKLSGGMKGHFTLGDFLPMGLLLLGSAVWAGGSLYSKYRSGGNSPAVNTTWQMMAAGLAFLISSMIHQEWQLFDINAVSLSASLSLLYLTIFGSILGFGAYVWLLKMQPVTKVSTYAYVNPLVAVMLGIFLANESVSTLQLTGLLTILSSVLLINLHKYVKIRKPVAVKT